MFLVTVGTLIDNVDKMANLLHTFGYATIALSVILVIFLALISYVIYQNKTLTQNLIKSNKDNIEDLQVAITKLTSSITKMNNSYELILEDIVKEISGLREKYIEVTNTFSNIIYDKKALSPEGFYNAVNRIKTIFIYKALIDLYIVLDNNGFDNSKMIELLKNDIHTLLERRRTEALNNIKDLNFDSKIINHFLIEDQKLYNQFSNSLNSEIIDLITLAELKEDKNYKRLKTLIKNKIFFYLDNILSLCKKITK